MIEETIKANKERLKEENKKQNVILEQKKIEKKRIQEELNELKRKEAKVRRQYNEMLNQKTGSSRASSAAQREAESDPNLDRTFNAKGGRTQSATRIS